LEFEWVYKVYGESVVGQVFRRFAPLGITDWRGEQFVNGHV